MAHVGAIVSGILQTPDGPVYAVGSIVEGSLKAVAPAGSIALLQSRAIVMGRLPQVVQASSKVYAEAGLARLTDRVEGQGFTGSVTHVFQSKVFSV